MYQVVKRDGTVVDFNINKISSAITKAFEARGREYHPSVIELISLHVASDFEGKIHDGKITVEEIQDSVEKVLSESGYADVAKAYILYRRQREKVRNINSTLLNYKDLVDNYLKINDWRVKENSTVTYSGLASINPLFLLWTTFIVKFLHPSKIFSKFSHLSVLKEVRSNFSILILFSNI